MAEDGAGPRLLLVDDEPAVLETLCAVLRLDGLQVDAVQSIAEASAAVGRSRYDVIVTDLRLGEDDGIDLIAAARHQDPDTEVILLTGYVSTESAIQAVGLGAAAYLTKPCNLDELRATINRSIDSRKRMRELRVRAEAAEEGRQ